MSHAYAAAATGPVSLSGTNACGNGIWAEGLAAALVCDGTTAPVRSRYLTKPAPAPTATANSAVPTTAVAMTLASHCRTPPRVRRKVGLCAMLSRARAVAIGGEKLVELAGRLPAPKNGAVAAEARYMQGERRIYY